MDDELIELTLASGTTVTGRLTDPQAQPELQARLRNQPDGFVTVVDRHGHAQVIRVSAVVAFRTAPPQRLPLSTLPPGSLSEEVK